jgi:hypothetical protein
MTPLLDSLENPNKDTLDIISSETTGSVTHTNPGGIARLGRSPFWMYVEPEEFGALRTQAYKLQITHRPPRKRNVGNGTSLLEISPRHSVFTLKINGETFPLIASECKFATRGNDIELSGVRKVYLDDIHTLNFSIKLKPVASKTGTQISVHFKCDASPCFPKKTKTDLQVELFSPTHHPEIWNFPYSPESHDGSFLLMDDESSVSISCVLPDVAPVRGHSQANCADIKRESGLIISRTVQNTFRGKSSSYHFSMRFDSARIKSHAKFMHLRHTQQQLEPAVPQITAPVVANLRKRAELAMSRITDKNGYHSAGIERVYFQTTETDHGFAEFCSGFPHFPLDAARSMLDWDRLMGDESAARLAILIARGIGTDFSVIAADSYGKCANKGAIWDRRLPGQTAHEASFSDFLGDDFHSIASTARTASGLFRVYQLTADPISLNAGVCAAQWLLLKQNDNGYYDGDRVDSSTGAVVHEANNMVGIEVIHALVNAYFATSNEVYIKAAHRIERYLITEMMPQFSAVPIFKNGRDQTDDTPATVAALARSVAVTHSLLHTRRSAEELEQVGIWLRSWDLSNLSSIPNIDQDGRFNGLYEIARAALALSTTVKDSAWLRIALSIGASIPEKGWDSWQSVPLFYETMLAVIGLLKNSAVNMEMITARAGWSDYAPDSSTYSYINVISSSDDGQQAPIDFLPLVSRSDGKALVPILAHGAAKTVQIFQNGRLPNLRDLQTNEIVCQPAPLHKMPFSGPWRWGVFAVDP